MSPTKFTPSYSIHWKMDGQEHMVTGHWANSRDACISLAAMLHDNGATEISVSEARRLETGGIAFKTILSLAD